MAMSEDELSKIQAQQSELNRKLNEKISGDLSNFQRTMNDILKQKQVSQRKYFIEKIREEQEQADSAIKSADWYSSMLALSP